MNNNHTDGATVPLHSIQHLITNIILSLVIVSPSSVEQDPNKLEAWQQPPIINNDQKVSTVLTRWEVLS